MEMLVSISLIVFVLVAAWRVALQSLREEIAGFPVLALQRIALAVVVVGAVAGYSLLMTTLIPPLQSPDENSHLQRAYSLADGHFLISKNTREHPLNQEVDTGLRSYIETWQIQLATKRDNRVTPAVEGRSRGIVFTGNEVEIFNGAAAYFPVLYAPASAGLSLAQLFGQPVWIGSVWARLGMWILSIVAFALAVAIARAGRWTTIAVGLLPMTLAQFGSVNLDAATISLGLLAVSLTTAGVVGGGNGSIRYARWQQLGCWCLIGMLAVTKPLFVALLIPPVFWSLRKDGLRLNLMAAAIVMLCVVGWMAHMANSFIDVRIANSGSTFSNLLTAMLSPVSTAELLLRTFEANSGFYWHTMIGVLGWLDTPMTSLLYYVGGALLASALVADAISYNRFKFTDRPVLALAAVAFVLSAFIIMLAAWTPGSARVIDGIQGRYFLPILPMFAAVFGRRDPRWHSSGTKLMALVIVLYLTILTLELPRILLYRYWL